MKQFKRPLMLIALAAVALWSCDKGGDGEISYGKLQYDVKTVSLNSAMYVDVSLPGSFGVPSYKQLIISNITEVSGERFAQTNYSLSLPIDPGENNEFDVTQLSGITFEAEGTLYFSNSDRRALYERWIKDGGTSIFGVKSLGIDPTTGKEIYGNDIIHYAAITDGRVKWTVGENSGKLEFTLTLEGGKTAAGSATIPNSVFTRKN